jgi:hypothetical protein
MSEPKMGPTEMRAELIRLPSLEDSERENNLLRMVPTSLYTHLDKGEIYEW